jgi:hypothetical protein
VALIGWCPLLKGSPHRSATQQAPRRIKGLRTDFLISRRLKNNDARYASLASLQRMQRSDRFFDGTRVL